MADSETPDTAFAAQVRAQNGIALTPQEAAGLAALVKHLNATVAAGADARVTIDSAPWSFETLRAEIAERGEPDA